MKRLNSTDEKVILSMEKIHMLSDELENRMTADVKNLKEALFKFKESLLILRDLSKLSSSIALNDEKFEDLANDLNNDFEDLAKEYKTVKESIEVITESVDNVNDVIKELK